MSERHAPETRPSQDAALPVDTARQAKVLAAAKVWTGQLVDVSGRNTLLFYKDLRQGTLDLSPGAGAVDVAVSVLLGSRTVRLSTLFRESDLLVGAAKRARTIQAKARENFEERGLQTLFVAWGMATWTNTRGTATPVAPVLLRQASLVQRGGSGEDFDLALTGEWELNPTLLHLLRTDYQVTPDPEELLDLLGDEGLGEPDPTQLWLRLVKVAGSEVPGFSIAPRVVLGNFSYAKLPMVEDLRVAAEIGLLEANDLLAAIAGDEGARIAVRARHVDVLVDEPDRVPPADEFLVLDADASQSYVINAVVAGGDIVVEGPPGTGKSQTIANLIATLAARHQRVLFVAEKRAAIDAVVDRLNRVGLGDLVLDLHDGAGSRRKLAQDLAKAMNDHANVALPDVVEDQARLVRRRETLVVRARALHETRSPWGVSVYDLQARLLGLPTATTTTLRLHTDVLDALDTPALAAACEDLRDYAERGGLSLARGASSPWGPALKANTITSTEDATAALAATNALSRRTLPDAFERLAGLVAECGLKTPQTVDGWADLLSLLDAVGATLERCDLIIYAAPLDELAGALEPATRGPFARFGARIGNADYRRARKRALALWRNAKPKSRTLHEAISAAATELKAWQLQSTDGGIPRLPADLAGAEGAYGQLGVELLVVGTYVGRESFGDLSVDEVQARLDALIADQVTLYKLPELHRLSTNLVGRGLGDVVDEASNRDLDPSAAVAVLEYAWLSSVLEAVSLADPVIGAFDGAAHRRVVRDFVEADRSHVFNDGPPRVRRAVAEWAIHTRDAFPDESDVVEKQARLKTRHLPVRQLFHAAPHVLGAMKPCWAMSPLVVAQLLPAERCFDVVIFDEASQVTPADAVGALLRSERAVVAGDTRQLPPTSFFNASGGDEDDEANDDDDGLALTSGLESVLDVMAALLPPPRGTRTLGWHYRSRDERLIAFSNAQPTLYDWSLTTFPGVATGDCITHELVPWRAGRVGQEDSVADEVTRVVDLILDHAQNRPDESLGVIAMGIKHANRIQEALRRARADHPELDRWFDFGPESRDDGSEPFFVKNLERVQGDERDAVILTVGYGKNPEGRMLYRFGPINTQGGERRLNVAITRARSRMTVVSSFSSSDMDPTRLRAEGAKMLGRYLAYAESSGANLGDVAKEKAVLNPFERDIRDKLSAAGIPLIAQFGCSGYWIDYAAQHPTRAGRMVLAIECDGASYHSSATARDRDRLRQDHLERLGWSFHRIWSTDWFRSRETEIQRAVEAWKTAVGVADRRDTRVTPTATASPGYSTNPSSVARAAIAAAAAGRPRGTRPRLARDVPIDQHPFASLVTLIRWIESDTLLRTEEELVAEAMGELGYHRRGARIVEALTLAVRAARSS
jgi:very-short-patch-repair endonuclease